MNSEKLQQLQDEIKQEMRDALNNSKLADLLTSYGLIDKTVKFQCVLDMKKIQFSNTIKDPELKNSLQAIPGNEIVIMGCCLCPPFCCNC
ncbi:MAG: hypothetical protein ACHBN1_10315 [Heteroscytonema crispum UTEX LB 1556]